MKRIRINLSTKIILLTVFVVIICLALATFISLSMFKGALQSHFGDRAMDVAKMAAERPQIVEGFDSDDPPDAIQSLAQDIRELTGASYVVIGNTDNIRYSHHDPTQIGEELGTSSAAALEEEESIIYQDIGVSGDAMKAKTPIYNLDGEVIGVSSVGFLFDDIEKELASYQASTAKYYGTVLLLGVVGAFLVARNIKKTIFGLEPEEISYLFKEKEAIVESIKDPIVAVDREGQVVSLNKKARSISHFHSLNIGDSIKHPQLQTALENGIHSAKEGSNIKVFIDNQIFVMDYASIKNERDTQGVVFTLRPISEIEELKKEYSIIKSFAEDMRAHNHEFQNKLNTIYGLIRLNKTKEALRLISKEVEDQQDFIVYLMNSVKNPVIAACLLGKAHRATEMKVTLEFDQDSELSPLPETINEQDVMAILGNVIDNSIESAYCTKGSEGLVQVSFTDLGPDLVFDIEDNGGGIDKEKEAFIFQDGYTTKPSSNSGVGLSIVMNALSSLKGDVYISKSSLGGAHFIITIPKERSD